jgi:hypothetical protein
LNANAVVAANKIAQGTRMLQIRAYIGISDPVVNFDGRKLNLEVTLRNNGATPAKNASVVVWVIPVNAFIKMHQGLSMLGDIPKDHPIKIDDWGIDIDSISKNPFSVSNGNLMLRVIPVVRHLDPIGNWWSDSADFLLTGSLSKRDFKIEPMVGDPMVLDEHGEPKPPV